MLILWFLIALPVITFLFLKTLFSWSRSGQPRRAPGPGLIRIITRLMRPNNSSNIHIDLAKLSEKCGPLMYDKLLGIMVISSARMAEEVFKHNDLAFSSRPSFTKNIRLAYNSHDIATAPYNECWRELRKFVYLRLFTRKQVNSFRHVREDEVSRMVKEISQQADHGLINVNEAAFSLSSSVIFRVALGKTYDQDDRFDKMLKDVQTFLFEFFFSDIFPMLGWVDWVTGKVSRLERVFKEMDSFIQEAIDEHLNPNRPASMDNDLLDGLIGLRDEGSSSARIDWDHVKGVVMNILVGGIDTTAATVTWAMTGLMKNPSSLKKVQEEIRNIIGKKGFVDEDDIGNFPYLKAVVKETLRFFPPDPLSIPRETLKPCIINGYEIQEKTMVVVNVWAIGRDPDYWESPTEFLPERFLHGNTIDFKGHDFGFLPFGSGRRQCPGIELAVTQIELALANLLYSFDWELPHGMTEDDVDIESSSGLTKYKKNALYLRAKNYLTV